MDNKSRQSRLGSSAFSRFRRPLLAAVFLVILIAGYFIVLSGPLQAYRENFSLLGRLKADSAVARADLEKAQGLAKTAVRLTPLENKLIDMALPLRPDDSSLVAQITSLAQKSGFAVSSIDIVETNGVSAAKANSEQIGRISMRLKIKGGGYEELKQFFSQLESSLMMIDVYSVSFNDKLPVYDLALVSYYYKAAAAK